MDSFSGFLLTALIGVLIGFGIGWADTHMTVASECERLGSFYVGSKTFTCTKIDRKEQAQ